MKSTLLFFAQGFGLGRIPFAPGTFGSLGGLLWTALLLQTGNFWIYLGGATAGALVAVWICGEAERILKQHDPGSIVLDEIVAVPFCFAFLFFIMAITSHAGGWPVPAPEFLFSRDGWIITLAVFAAFRLFDIWKPWPVRQAQALRGGWGVVVDDLLAALYVNLLAPLFIFG